MERPSRDVFDIGEFLAQQVAEGDVESQGEFTVSQEKAARKLGRLALPFNYAWVLKIVQAAVAWKSSRIEVRQYRTFTVFAFLPPDSKDLPSEEQLVGTLLSRKVSDETPLALFCHGLRGLVEQAGLSFRLILNDGDGEFRPIHAGPDATALAEEERSVGLGLAPGVRLLVGHLPLDQFFMVRYVPKPFLSERADLKIARTLDRYCFLCPVPLILDGRRVDRLLAHPQWGFRSGRRPVALTPFRCSAFPSALVPKEFEEKLIAVQTHPRRAQRTYDGNRNGNVWLYLDGLDPSREPGQLTELKGAVSRRHNLLFVCRGVVVGRYVTSISTRHLGLTVIVAAEGFDTDLSGLSLIHDDRMEEAIRQLMGLVSRRLTQLGANPDVFVNDQPDEHSADDDTSYQLAVESHREAAALVGTRFPAVKTGLAAVLFAKNWITSWEAAPAPLEDALAVVWLDHCLKDLEELETIVTARFEDSGWFFQGSQS